MRRDKIPTVIFIKKHEDEIHFHCSNPAHNAVRLLEIPGKGLWCPLGCGPSIPAIRKVFTFMKQNPSSPELKILDKQTKRDDKYQANGSHSDYIRSHSADANAVGDLSPSRASLVGRMSTAH